MKNTRPSRLSRHYEKQSQRQAVIYIVLSVLFVLAMVKFGIPALIRLLDSTTGKKTTMQSPSSQEIPPQAPSLSPLPEATFSAQIKVSGLAQPNININKKFLIANL